MPSFAISKTTSKILKNFAGISNSVVLSDGKEQKTIASGKSVLAVAQLPEAWPQETGIYDLNSFLGILSLQKEPKIEFGEDQFIIAEGRSRIKYRYSDTSTILVPPNKTLKTDNPTIEFTLSGDVLTKLNKAAAMLGLTTVTVALEGGDVVVRATDPKNPSSHGIEETIADEAVSGDRKAKIALSFKQEHFAMLLEGDYKVSLSNWPYGVFEHTSEPIKYFIVAQA